MQFALLISESPDAYAPRKNHAENDHYLGTWRANHKPLVHAESSSAAIHWKRRSQELRYELEMESGAYRTAPLRMQSSCLGILAKYLSQNGTSKASGQGGVARFAQKARTPSSY